LKAAVGKRLARFPWLSRRFAPMLAACDGCTKKAST
jgi:hypothetical protein